jgi:ABC-type uncharacterized transport system involved in gliding motility auxiliary subunit
VLLWGRCGAAHWQQAAAVAGATQTQAFSLHALSTWLLLPLLLLLLLLCTWWPTQACM